MKKNAIILLLLIISFNVFSQDKITLEKDKFIAGRKGLNNIWKQVKISEDFYNQNNRGGYMFALEGYLLGYEYNKDYPEMNYKIGICYMNSVYKPLSLKFFKKAYSQESDISKDILWQLALAYQYNFEFDSAMMYFDSCLISIPENIVSKDKINKRIKECNIGKTMLANPQDVIIEDVEEINTKYPEYCPVIVADESRIYFTARRPDCVGGSIDNYDGQFYEDIFYSDFVNGKWTEPQNPGFPLNTRYHDATVALSPDGNSMLIFRNGDLLLSKYKDGKWSFPEYLPENINTEEMENSACFSFDGNTIYFVRGKKQNIDSSNSDIYVTHFKENKWSDPVRLPDVINSPYDEDGVFLHPDGRTLYFSSMGHNSMGGFDIFKSVKQPDGTWSEPVNMGYPVNSPDDDVYFVLSADGKTGYYSSTKKDTKGFNDIYKLSFKPETLKVDTQYVVHIDTIITPLTTANDVQLTLVTGIVIDGLSNKPVSGAVIEVFDNNVDSLLLKTYSNSDGKYVVTLPSGTNYGISITSEGFLFHSENFDLPANQKFQKVIKDVVLNDVVEGKKIILKNIFFDFNKSTLSKESIPELDRIYYFLKNNKKLVVEISGHTDNVGNHDYNQKLSEQRAKAVVDYLIKKGITPSRLKYRGAAYDEPLVPNDTEEHKQMNRRVEFKVLSNK